jgi:WD40 repeat protein
MVHSDHFDHIDEQNRRSQFVLERSLFHAPQEFSLLLVRCNYHQLAESILRQLCLTQQLEQLWQQQEAEFICEYYADQPFDALMGGAVHKGLVCLHLTTLSTNLEDILRLVFSHLEELNIQRDCVAGVMVFCLEHVGRLQLSLALLNQVRDQLSYLLPCPLVLWLTDRGAQKLFRLAPDVKSWAVTSIQFVWDTVSLQRLWRKEEKACFRELEEMGGLLFIGNDELGLGPYGRRRLELELSHKELLERQALIPPFVSGFWAFVNGREAYGDKDLVTAHAAYSKALQIYGQLHSGVDITPELLVKPGTPLLGEIAPDLQRRLAILFFHFSLLYDELAQERSDAVLDWQQGQVYLRGSLALWNHLRQWRWVAHLTMALGLMLRQLRSWDALEELAWQTTKKLDVYCSQMLLTRNYGLLAEVAIAREQWEKAEMLAHSAIETYDHGDETASQHDLPWYFLVLAQAKQHLASPLEAIAHLEQAHSLIRKNLDRAQRERQTWNGWYQRLYYDILQTLQQFHWRAGNYRDSFDLHRELQQCEEQWGWRVFFGAAALPEPKSSSAPELRETIQRILQASRRCDDVQRLLERLSRDEHKLTILHGVSGVGKTSLLQAGLMPSLRGQMVNARETLPIMLKQYGQWRWQLSQAIATYRIQFRPPLDVSIGEDPMALLQDNGSLNLLTVLIFDQFEQFLEQYPTPSQRRDFFQFLSQCLQLPFVKIILSLREDHLAYLLEWETQGDLAIVNDNLLDRSVRYRLGNLEAIAAHDLLTCLSGRSAKSLEPELIDRLVQDINHDHDGIRPIELQVLSFQLQQDSITSLSRYLDLGKAPKQMVLERFLLQIVHQCGDENYALAWEFLYRLTNARQTRPEVSQEDFVRTCQQQYGQAISCQATVDLILHIFVGSGLVMRHHYGTQQTYQLVHDYLVRPIRHYYEHVQSQQLADRLASQDRELSRIRRHWAQSVITIVALLGVVASTIVLARRADSQRYQQWQVTQNAELMALSSASEALFYGDQQFEALLESLRATVRLRQLLQEDAKAIAPATRLKVLSTLEQSYFGLQEKNRFEGHTDSVFDVSISPDGQMLASGGWDTTVRLWNPDGKLINVLKGHKDRVTRVVFAPDGQSLFSSSWDNTVQQWSLSGKRLRSIDVKLDSLTAINLSPDGQWLAIASSSGSALLDLSNPKNQSIPLNPSGLVYWTVFSPDGEQILTLEDNNQITLWDRLGKRQQILRLTGDAQLLFATFSPDGKTIVGTDTQGNLTFWERGDRQAAFPDKGVSLLAAHSAPIFFLSFNADGSQFVTGGADNVVKVWSRDFTLLHTFYGHRDAIRAVIFHPQRQEVISASMDKTVRLWELTEDSRIILKHNQPIRDISFSPNGQKIATASQDKTIRIWQRQDGKLLNTLSGHTDWVNAVAWNPNGQQLVSASDDRTLRLWSVDGKLLKTLRGHGDRILDVQWSPDGEFFASAGLDKSIRIWSKEGNLLQVLTEHQERVNGIHFSPDSKLLASASDDKTVRVWQRRKDNSFFLVSRLEPHDSWVTDVTFSNDGKYLAFSGYDNLVEIRRMTYKNNNPEFGAPLVLKGHSDSVAHLQFNPNVPILATSSWNNQLQLWQLDDTLLKTLNGHRELITGLDWSPDGEAIATSSQDNTAIIWDLNLDVLLNRSCHWLRPYLLYNPKVRDGDRQLCEAPQYATSKNEAPKNELPEGQD